MTIHLLIGGSADGLQVDINPELSSIRIGRDDGTAHEYHRVPVMTPSSAVDLFVHGVDDPLAMLLALYEQKRQMLVDLGELANDASRYREMIAPAAEPLVSAALDAVINNRFTQQQQSIDNVSQDVPQCDKLTP